MPVQLEISVVPNSRAFAIGRKDGKLKVWLTEEAERGKANSELVTELSKVFGCGVRILRGATGRRKTLLAECDEKAVETALARFLK